MRVSAFLVLLGSSGLASAQSMEARLPGWLAGGWSTQSEDGSWAEEWWTSPRAGSMLGAARSGNTDKLDWFEHTRIEQDGGKIRFCALPRGQAGACFDAVRIGANEIVFENARHDFPNRVSYRRDGEELFAEISGKEGANSQTWRFRKND